MNFSLLNIQGAVGVVNKIGSTPSPWNKGWQLLISCIDYQTYVHTRLTTPYKLWCSYLS